MNANDLYQYLDSISSKKNLEDIPVYISEKYLAGFRDLETAFFVSQFSKSNDSIILCPVPMTRNGQELKTIFGNEN